MSDAIAARAQCSIDGCTKPTRSKSADLCKMHYHRQYRHGSTQRVATHVHTSAGRRYRLVSVPGHPLAWASGRAYAHRVALYDVIGAGVHSCNWCGVPVSWSEDDDCLDLEVDHINGVGDDNRADNLVPSCHRCNNARAQQHRHDELTAAGWWASNDTAASYRL